MKEIGFYIHVPFCRAKCYYCDFNSYAGREDYIPAYFNALKNEISIYSEMMKDYYVKTVFIGGGTPSLVDTQHIYEIINLCNHSFNIIPGAEISIEANPGTLSKEKLLSYKAIGINRLSMGLQACQDNLLKSIGRIHTRNEFVSNFNQAVKAGFKNINVDLIFGMPGQLLKEWNETLSDVMELEPAHISCYSLKIEEGTTFGRMLEHGDIRQVEDELDREMYYEAISVITGKGYRHYEISNFAMPGFESRHNMIYWNAQEYIGVGAGAHSYFQGRRYNNTSELDKYINLVKDEGIPKENITLISKDEEMSEYMILGLRLVDGISPQEFSERFGVDLFELYHNQLDELTKGQLLEYTGKRIRLTQKGLDLANQVFMAFL